MIRKIKWSLWKDDLKEMSENLEDDSYEDSEIKNIGMALHTKMGMLPMPMMNLSFVSDKVQFYIAETNFGITHDIINVVANAAGVISVEPLTRYSFRVGIPKSGLFDYDKTQELINKCITDYFNQPQDELIQTLEPITKQKVIDIRNYLNQRNEFWTLLVLPNGNMEVTTADSLDDKRYKEQQQLYVKTHLAVGGKLLTSQDFADEAPSG